MDPKQAALIQARLEEIMKQLSLVIYARLLVRCGVRQQGMRLYKDAL